MPRDMIYNQFSCDLIVAGSGNDIYRMSLDEGRFLSSLTSDSTSMNTLFHNQNLNVLMCGSGKNTNDGLIEIWDYREKEKIGRYTFY